MIAYLKVPFTRRIASQEQIDEKIIAETPSLLNTENEVEKIN